MDSKTYFFLIASNQKNITITKEKVLEEGKRVPLIQNSYEYFNKGCRQKV